MGNHCAIPLGMTEDTWDDLADRANQTSKPCTELFKPSLRSISPSIKKGSLKSPNSLATLCPGILFWQLSVNRALNLGIKKINRYAEHHQCVLQVLAAGHKAEQHTSNKQRRSACKEVISRISGRNFLCNEPATNIFPLVCLHPPGLHNFMSGSCKAISLSTHANTFLSRSFCIFLKLPKTTFLGSKAVPVISSLSSKSPLF